MEGTAGRKRAMSIAANMKRLFVTPLLSKRKEYTAAKVTCMAGGLATPISLYSFDSASFSFL